MRSLSSNAFSFSIKRGSATIALIGTLTDNNWPLRSKIEPRTERTSSLRNERLSASPERVSELTDCT